MLNSRNIYPLWLLGVTLIFTINITIHANFLNDAALCYLIVKKVGFIFSTISSAGFFFFINSSISLSDQGPSSNKFANDGSFLQQFMKMQKEKSNSVSG